MTDTSTEAVERLAHQMDNLGFDDAFELIHALAAERDKWHAGWMEAEAKVSELGAEHDALKAEVKRLRDALDDANSIIAFQEAKLEAYEEMAPPRDPDLLRKRLAEVKKMKEKKND
jgi:uncharacterized coiled-coil DUF342 family protein